jgi:uncharacterized protein (DUF302 family)
MKDYERRIVVDSGFETVLGDASRAIREEGLQTIARIDVRDHFWRDIGHDFRRYFLIAAWSPDLALEALRSDLDVAASLPTTFAIYELADGETAVVAKLPELETVAARESERVARVLDRLQRRPAVPSVASAA